MVSDQPKLTGMEGEGDLRCRRCFASSAPASSRTGTIIGHFTACRCALAFRRTPFASGGYDLPASIYEPIASGVSPMQLSIEPLIYIGIFAGRRDAVRGRVPGDLRGKKILPRIRGGPLNARVNRRPVDAGKKAPSREDVLAKTAQGDGSAQGIGAAAALHADRGQWRRRPTSPSPRRQLIMVMVGLGRRGLPLGYDHPDRVLRCPIRILVSVGKWAWAVSSTYWVNSKAKKKAAGPMIDEPAARCESS